MGIFSRDSSSVKTAHGVEVRGTYKADTLDGAGFEEAIQAAVGPLQTAGKRKRWFSGIRADWESSLFDFDRHGPSFLGFYLDLVSEYPSMCDIIIQKWEDGKWELDDSPQASVDLRGLRGVNEERPQLIARIIRLLELPGRMAWIPIEEPLDPDDPDSETETRFAVVPVHVLEEKKQNGIPFYLFMEEPDLKPGQPGARLIPKENVKQIWRPDIEYPGMHWTPLQRAIPELRLFRNVQRTISRSAASKLLNADLLWIEGEASDLAVKVRNDGQGAPGAGRRLGYLGVALQKMIQAGKQNLDDIREENVAAAFPHPFVSPKEPKRVKIGRPYDPEALAAKQDALTDFARGQNIPMSVLVEGQGAGARLLNNVKQDEAFKETSLFPKLGRACNGLTGVWLRPLMEASGRGAMAQDRRVWFTKAALEPEGDPKQIGEAVNAGILTRQCWADSLGKGDKLLPLPDGVSEAEWLLAMKGGGAPAVPSASPQDDAVRERVALSREGIQASAWWEN